MPDLQPISSEKDILAEAASVVSPSPFRPMPVQSPIQQQPVVDIQSQPATQPQPAPVVQQASISAPIRSAVFVPQTVTVETAANDAPNTYAYQLPMTSYVIAWFYLVSAAVIGGILIYFLYLLGQFSKYASQYSSSQDSMQSTTSQLFGSVIMPLILIIVACIATYIFIRRNTKTSRYVCLAIAGSLIAYQIYWANQLFTTTSNSGYSSASTWSTLWAYYAIFIIPFLPYLLLPIATVVYLVTGKASRAYARIF